MRTLWAFGCIRGVGPFHFIFLCLIYTLQTSEEVSTRSPSGAWNSKQYHFGGGRIQHKRSYWRNQPLVEGDNIVDEDEKVRCHLILTTTWAWYLNVRLVFFHSKKQISRCQPTHELKVVESNTNILNGEEDVSVPSKPKHLKPLTKCVTSLIEFLLLNLILLCFYSVVAFFQRKNGHEGR